MKYIKNVGRGTFGDVHHCVRPDGIDVAIKRFFITRGNHNWGIINVKELNCAVHVAKDNPYLAGATSIYFDCPFPNGEPMRGGSRMDKLFIETPLAVCDVQSLIYETEYKSEVYDPRVLMHQMLLGLQSLHADRIAHRDIKPNNVLFYRNPPSVKLTDFGMTRILKPGDQNTKSGGSPMYIAPEAIMTRNMYSTKIDIWSLGTCFVEMATKHCLLKGGECEAEKFIQFSKIIHPSLTSRLLEKMTNGLVSYSLIKDIKPVGIPQFVHGLMTQKFRSSLSEERIEEFVDLLSHMLVFDPNNRFTVIQCLQHPFFLDPTITTSLVVQLREPKFGKDVQFCQPHWDTTVLDSVFRPLKAHNDASAYHQNGALFLGLDIYMRVSNSLFTKPTDTKEAKYVSKKGHVVISTICIYLAYKFRFDELTPSYTSIFQNLVEKLPSRRVVEQTERYILFLLKYHISRMTIYDCIPNSPTIIDIVFEYMISSTDYYGYDLHELSDVIRNTITAK
jgi:serine/threonine protein kinase